MNNDTLIEVKAVSKKFTATLRRSMRYGVSDILHDLTGRREQSLTLREGEFLSLTEISAAVNRGECLAVIGPNGSGKSSLMKIISGIYRADQGEACTRGRVCSLIEVGAGFHPLLTGRENIYLNGAICGLDKKAIDRVFDDIVEFSGIEKFIDMPVKNYSSGMYVRLGFAIAVHSEPDILLIDEVLAVGDAGFRARCYNRLHDLAAQTAIVFISHAMEQVSRIATKVMVLDSGKQVFAGDVAAGIQTYNRMFAGVYSPERHGNGEIRVTDIMVAPTIAEFAGAFDFSCTLDPKITTDDVVISLVFRDMNDVAVLEINGNLQTPVRRFALQSGRPFRVSAHVPGLMLNPGLYYLNVLLTSANRLRHYDWLKNSIRIEVFGHTPGIAPVQVNAEWETSDDIIATDTQSVCP